MDTKNSSKTKIVPRTQRSKLGLFTAVPQPEGSSKSEFYLSPQKIGSLRDGQDEIGKVGGTRQRAVIVKVKEAGYVPKGISVRARVSPILFTASVKPLDIAQLESDPLVHSISVSKSL